MSASPDSPSNAPRKRLPVRPSVEHLKKQAKRAAKADALPLAKAQHRLAGEYGCRDWAELMRVVETMNRGSDQLANVQRDVEALPAAVRRRDVARVKQLLAAGDFTQHDLDAALAHAAWYGGDAPDVLIVRRELFDLLLAHGADPDGQYGSAYGPIVFGTGECQSPEGLQWLLDAGCDVGFPPVDTKYGKQCALSAWLNSYVRSADNARKHRGIALLLARHAFVPPDLHRAVLAIHRGDAAGLAKLVDAEPDLVRRRFCNEYALGNIELRGATLLHTAVEFGEIACVDVLLDRGADINDRADVIDGVGGQTPIYHAINTNGDGNFAMLQHLVRSVGQYIDMSVRATWRGTAGWAIRDFDPTATPLTPLEYAEKAARDIDPKHAANRPRAQDELALLRSLDRRAGIRHACASGDVATVGRMLDASPELLTPELWPPAVYQAGSLELVSLLLARGLDPNQCSAPRRPLHLAVYRHLADVIDLLLANGADANDLNPLGERPLDLLDAYEARPVGDADTRQILAALEGAGATITAHHLARVGDSGRLAAMLDQDATLVGPDATSWTPLMTAARSGRADIARLLIDRGAAVDAANDKGNTPLWFACQSGTNAADRLSVVRLLLERGAHVNRHCEDQSTPLHYAAWRGPIGIVELLLRHGAREWMRDKDGKLPRDYAARGVAPDKTAIEHLLTRPVIGDPNFRAAVAAIQAGDVPTLRRLLAEHPNLATDAAVEPACYPPGYFGNPKLLWFVANNPNLVPTMPANMVEVAETILAAGVDEADVSYTLGLVMTSDPVMASGLLGPLMAVLLEHGAKPTADVVLGSLGHGQRDAIDMLLAAGVAMTAPIAAGLGRAEDLASRLAGIDAEALHDAFSMAVINGQIGTTRSCLAAGADVNRPLRVHTHSTALHHAAGNGMIELIRLLLASGADATIRDTLWRGTPLGWAEHGGHAEAAALLRPSPSPASSRTLPPHE